MSPVVISITKEYHIAQARQSVRAVCGLLLFNSVDTCSIATSVSELAGNIFFHTTSGGAITIKSIKKNDRPGIEIIAEDDGPGIPDVDLAMQDGYSTSGGLGSGLPGVKRLMDEFEIFSKPNIGTRIIVRKWK